MASNIFVFVIIKFLELGSVDFLDFTKPRWTFNHEKSC